MLFNLACDLFDYLTHEIDRVERESDRVQIDVATYGISLFDEKHEYEPGLVDVRESKAKTFVKRIADFGYDTRLLVGIQDVRKYKNGSFGLTNAQFTRKISEVLMIGEQYGIRALPTTQSHLKMYRINDLYVVGGINLSNSYWTDSAVVLEHQEDKERMQFIFDSTWRGAGTVHPLTPECMRICDDEWREEMP